MQKFILRQKLTKNLKSDCLLLCMSLEKGSLKWTESGLGADKACGGILSKLVERGVFTGEAGDTVLVHCKDFSHQRILLVGLGEGEERKGLACAAKALIAAKAKKVVLSLEKMSSEIISYFLIEIGRVSYKFNLGGYTPNRCHLEVVEVVADSHFTRQLFNQSVAVVEGLQLTQHLAEQPSNICTPQFLAETASVLAKKTKLKASHFDEKEMKKKGMNALLAVGQGSENSSRFIVLEHCGGKKGVAPIALVGKGVTFDTGGISLKPGAAMDEMKFDMCGAATVLGVLLALDRAKVPLNVVGVIPAVENMPDGKSVKPGDVITAMNGKTIEILNTDAEGRLILADALAYTERKYKPTTIIDMATLTGACVIALGHHMSGLMGRGEKLLSDLQAAGMATGDRCWELPMGEQYQDQLKTDYADVANIGGRSAGTITAACFLSRFVQCSQWAHLDIAGTSWSTKKRATGRPLPLLMHYLISLSQK